MDSIFSLTNTKQMVKSTKEKDINKILIFLINLKEPKASNNPQRLIKPVKHSLVKIYQAGIMKDT